MAMHVSDENNTPRMPAAGETTAPELTPGSNRGAGLADTAGGKIANEEAWAAWEAKGQGSSRPPWWLLLLGLLALGVVYWLWGGLQR